MKVFLDENFPLTLVHRLRDDGYDADHVITLGWREALQSRKGMRRARLRRLQGLLRELQNKPLTDAELAELRDSAHVARPLAERVVAAIIGVPA